MTPAEDTNDRILTAALELFAERGYAGTTTRAIADRAGVNEVTLFRNFGSKEAVFSKAIDREVDVTAPIAEFQFPPDGDIVEVLSAAGMFIHRKMLERAPLVKIVMVEAARDPAFFDYVSHAPMMLLDILERYLTEAARRGEIGGADPRLAAVTFFSFFYRSLTSNAFLGEDVFIEMSEKNIRAFARLFVDGLRHARE